jgi:cytosine/creatinine deaminase
MPLPARYWLAGAQVAPALLDEPASGPLSLLIEDGRIASIAPVPAGDDAVFDLCGASVFSGFVDPHTHLDKGDLLAAGLRPERDLMAAVRAVRADYANWSRHELERRIAFGLRTAYAHGTRAVNSYCDWSEPGGPLAWQVLCEQRESWRGRIELVLTSLADIDLLSDDAAAQALGRSVAEAGGVLGFFVYPGTHVAALLPRAFVLAQRFDLRLDLHIDEHTTPATTHLPLLAKLARECGWGPRTVCGHACVLAALPPAESDAALDAMAASGIALVSLPLTNLYLQDSTPGGPRRTPRLRGIAPLHEARARGITLALGSDNHRDGFFPGGDLDPLQTLALAAMAAQLDDPAVAWIDTITCAAARVLHLPWDGILRVGAPADLVIHPGRNSAEVIGRAPHGRTVLRAGRLLDGADAVAPDLRELDGLRH